MKTAEYWEEFYFGTNTTFPELVGMIREEALTEAATKVIPATSFEADKNHAKMIKNEIKNIF